MTTREHWEQVYRTRRTDEVSWFQQEPGLSLDLIRRVAPLRTSRIIDVGSGASSLVDVLLREGYERISVLDLSGAALLRVRDRLGALASTVEWREADILTAELSPSSVDVWHDRAVFHFLTEPDQRRAYVAQISRALRPGGHAILATFAEDGPTKCSGLPVVRYSAEALHREFGGAFTPAESTRELHTTPSGAVQAFVYCVLLLGTTRGDGRDGSCTETPGGLVQSRRGPRSSAG